MGAPSVILALGAEKVISDTIDKPLQLQDDKKRKIIEAEFQSDKQLLIQKQNEKQETLREKNEDVIASTRSRFVSSGLSPQTTTFDSFVRELQRREQENLKELQGSTQKKISLLEKQKNQRLSFQRTSSGDFLGGSIRKSLEPYRQLTSFFSKPFKN